MYFSLVPSCQRSRRILQCSVHTPHQVPLYARARLPCSFSLNLDDSISSEARSCNTLPSMEVIASASAPHFAKCHSTPSLSLACLILYGRAHSQRRSLSFVPELIVTTHFDLPAISSARSCPCCNTLPRRHHYSPRYRRLSCSHHTFTSTLIAVRYTTILHHTIRGVCGNDKHHCLRAHLSLGVSACHC